MIVTNHHQRSKINTPCVYSQLLIIQVHGVGSCSTPPRVFQGCHWVFITVVVISPVDGVLSKRKYARHFDSF